MFNKHSLKSVWSSPAIYAMNCVSTFTGAAQTKLENKNLCSADAVKETLLKEGRS